MTLDAFKVLKPRALTAREVALAGVMAAVMAVAAFIPVTVVAGVGKVISAAVILEPLIGILLGPVLGTYAAAAGAFVGQIIAPQGNIFHYLTFVPPTVGALTAGLLSHKKWKAGCSVILGVLLLWYTTSIGRELFYYPYMLLVFLGLVLLFRDSLGEWIDVNHGTVEVKGAGIKVLMAGILLMVIPLFNVVDFFTLGIMTSGIAGFLWCASLLKNNSLKNHLLKKVSALLFLPAGIFLSLGLRYEILIAGLVFVSFLFLALFLLGYTFARLSFLFFGVSIIVCMYRVQLSFLEGILYLLMILGIFLFSHSHFTAKPALKKWSGLILFFSGIVGLVQRFLLISSDSQVIRRELLQLKDLPFTTSFLQKEMDITGITDYYLQRVLPVYVNHAGWFLILVALVILSVSLFLNVSLEKFSVAYFIIAGCAVLSDLMVGNFLAIHILSLKAGMFRAFLFIYPVERIFMAFFATIFGVGVFFPLKRFGIYTFIRR